MKRLAIMITACLLFASTAYPKDAPDASKSPAVVLCRPVEKLPPKIIDIYKQAGKLPPPGINAYSNLEKVLEKEEFRLKTVNLNDKKPFPEEYDVLLVINPGKLDEGGKREINRALVEGKPTLIAVQNYEMRYDVGKNTIEMSMHYHNPNTNDILSASGIEVKPELVLDKSSRSVRIAGSDPLKHLFKGGIPIDVPMNVLIKPSSMDKNLSITRGLGGVFFPCPGRIETDKDMLGKSKLVVSTVLFSSPRAWTMEPARKFTQTDFDPPGEQLRQMSLAVLVEGQFPNAYPKLDGKLAPRPGNLILIGCAAGFQNTFAGVPDSPNNRFFLNCVRFLLEKR